MKKQGLTLILSLLLVLSLFTGCVVIDDVDTEQSEKHSTERTEQTHETLEESSEKHENGSTESQIYEQSTELTESISEEQSTEITEHSSKEQSTEVTESSNEEQCTEITESASEEQSTEVTESSSEEQSTEVTESSSEEQSTEASESTSEAQTTERLEETSCEQTTEPAEETQEPDTDCDHTDKDNNGKCDDCMISVIIEFDLYAINDLHGKILDNTSQPGVDELTTYLKNAYSRNPNTILFSSGDMWQGTAESGLTRGQMMTDWMNELDFAFMTLGNHEFDWGEKYIAQNATIAEFPFLAINIYDSDTRERADFCRSSVMLDLGEIQIGFIGAIGDCYSSISGDMREGVYFLTGTYLTNVVKAESERLRTDGADFIVYSLHDSTDGCDISLTRDGYVDIVFEGHSHQAYTNVDSSGAYHIQGGGDNSGMSHASVSFNFANMNKEIDAEVIYNSEYEACEPDDIVDTLMTKYDDAATLLNSPLGTNDEYRNSTFIKNLVAELYAELAVERWSQYDVVLGGGFLSCRSPSKLEAGEVKYGDLYTLLPFDNKIALCSCSGADLLKNYINTTNGNYYISYTEYGNSIKDSIDESKTYYIITDSYNYTYSPNNLTVIEVLDDVTYARDLVAEYIKNYGLTAHDPSNTVITPIPELLDIAKGLGAGNESTAKYYVKGEVVEIVNTTYGNMYIKDGLGNKLYIYGVNKNGVQYGSMTDKPKAGDTVILYGALKHYVPNDGASVYEMIYSELIEQN